MGDVARRGGGEVARVSAPWLPGSGGRGMEGGGVGRDVGPVDLRAPGWDCEDCEAERARAMAAASGERDSRL